MFRPVGEVSLQEGIRRITAAIACARGEKVRKLLLVTTGLSGFASPSVLERYEFMQEWARAAAGGAMRIALVARPDFIDPQKFGVTVARNLGLTCDVFSTEEQALHWLRGTG